MVKTTKKKDDRTLIGARMTPAEKYQLRMIFAKMQTSAQDVVARFLREFIRKNSS